MRDDDDQRDDEQLAELEDLVEQIQVGDRTEGAQAIRKIMERTAGSRDIGAEVRNVQALDRAKAEVDEALAAFKERWPEMVSDELLAQSGLTVIRREIEKDLKREYGTTDEALEPVRENSAVMTQAYLKMRVDGKGRPANEMFGVVGEILGRRFNIRPQAPGRVGEVRRVNPGDPEVIAREEEKRRAAIHKARADRGYSNDEEFIAPIRRSTVVQTDRQREAEAKRAADSRTYMEQRLASHHNKRNAGSQSPDAY
jgi:hypothetical protein